MRVDEQSQLAVLQIQGMLHLQLEIGEAFDAGKARGLQAFQQQRAEGVVATAGVAVAEDQEFGIGRQWGQLGKWVN